MKLTKEQKELDRKLKLHVYKMQMYKHNSKKFEEEKQAIIEIMKEVERMKNNAWFKLLKRGF
mgnify:CR=1 FL=1